MPGTDTGVVETATPVPVTDVAPITVAGAPMWLLLGDDGRVGRWHPGSGRFEQPAAASVRPEPDRTPRPGGVFLELRAGTVLTWAQAVTTT
ncbi:hypothetical protein ACFPIJ_07555 [Dactylosporangium cerinum]|uniref:Uncharacterized protein n=1 Tax=Dactylosporangium cerinum TaxID=1434730 RepID=A0ABV9VQY5_9ACTN